MLKFDQIKSNEISSEIRYQRRFYLFYYDIFLCVNKKQIQTFANSPLFLIPNRNDLHICVVYICTLRVNIDLLSQTRRVCVCVNIIFSYLRRMFSVRPFENCVRRAIRLITLIEVFWSNKCVHTMHD